MCGLMEFFPREGFTVLRGIIQRARRDRLSSKGESEKTHWNVLIHRVLFHGCQEQSAKCSRPIIPIQAAILNGLKDMRRENGVAVFQVRNRSCHFEDAPSFSAASYRER